MKTIIKIPAASLIVLFFICYAAKAGKLIDDSEIIIEPPVLIDQTVFLYQAGDIFLGGQPEMKTLDTLLDLGVTLVINVRTGMEVMAHNIEAYDEEDYVKEIGLEYIQIPIGGNEGFTPAAITGIDQAIKKTSGKVLIHCRTAGRATLAWMAWLINYRNYSIDDAVELGKKAQFSFPLPELLGYPVTIQKAD